MTPSNHRGEEPQRSEGPGQAESPSGQARLRLVMTPETLSGDVGTDTSTKKAKARIELNDAYYEEIRQAVGRGAPSVLLGTSNRSLERNLQKLKAVQQDKPAPSAGKPVKKKRWLRGNP